MFSKIHIISFILLTLLAFSTFASLPNASALSAITFTTKTTVASDNTQWQRVYENSTNSVIYLDADNSGNYHEKKYSISSGSASSLTATLSGSGNTINSAAYQSPIETSRYSVRFDGINDSVTRASFAGIHPTNAMTLIARVKMLASTGPIDAIATTSISDDYFMQANGAVWRWYVQNTAGTYGIVYSSTPVQTNVWVNLAGVYDGVNVKLYVNGNLEATTPLTGQIHNGGGFLSLGNSTGGRLWNGLIDDFMLYSDSKSQTQIQSILNGTPDFTSLQLWYDFNEGIGATATDLVSGANASLNAGTTWSVDVPSDSYSRLMHYIVGRDTTTGNNGYAKLDTKTMTKLADSYPTSSYHPRAIAQSTGLIYSPLYNQTTNGNMRLGIQTRVFGSYNEPSIYSGTSGNPAYGVLMDSSASDGSNIEMYGASTNWIAEKVTASSSLVGKKLDMITLYLQKTGAPPGNAAIGVFNAAGATTFTCSTQTGAGLTTSEAAYTFMCGSTYTIQSGDYIGIKYTGGDGANKILVSQTAADVFDGTNSVWSSSGAGPAWTDDNTKDLRGLFTDSANVKIAVIDGSPDKEYVFFESGTSSLAVVKYTNSATTITTALSHTAGKEYSIIQLSGKIIIQTDSATYSLNTSSDAITTLYSSTFLTRYPQSFTISPAIRTYSSSGLMIANSTYAALAVPSTGTVTSTGILVSSTVDRSGTLVTYQPSSYYYLPQNTLVTEGPATTWTIKALGSSLQIAPNSYSEHLSVNLQSNSTLFSQDVFRLVCGTGSYHVIYSKYAIGDDSDCAAWRVLASSSVSVGREIFDPYSRTPDLVHTAPQTAYTFTLSATDPTVYTLKSLYNNKVVDVNIFDASGQSQQRYLYGQCYTIQVHNNNDGSIINPGQICANDATTKSLNLQTINVPQNWTDAGWHYNVTRTFGTGNVTTSNIQFTVKYNPTPYTARVLTTDSYLTTYQTFHTWYNFTNVNATSSVAITKPNNSTIYFIVYDNHDVPRLTVASHGKAVNLSALTNAFAPIGNLFGIPLTAFFVVLGAAIFVKSNSPFGVIVVAALAGFMFATGLIPISAAAWGGIMVVAALGAIYAIKRF